MGPNNENKSLSCQPPNIKVLSKSYPCLFTLGRFGIGGSKSSGIAVGKWGSTSYTSLKKPNGFSSQKDQAVTLQSSNTDSGIGVARKREWTNSEMPQSLSSSSVANSVPRPKKFFKSRDTSSKPSEQPQQVNTEIISEKPRIEAGKCFWLKLYEICLTINKG